MRYHMKIDTVTGETTMTPMKATTDAEAEAELQQFLDDCPECQELRARGVVPTATAGEPPWWKRPRWRDLKKQRS